MHSPAMRGFLSSKALFYDRQTHYSIQRTGEASPGGGLRSRANGLSLMSHELRIRYREESGAEKLSPG